VKAIVADAAEFARTTPEPAEEELFNDIYAGEAA
jgi:TPP-dependent pyruvate/acetoin dehydrogenase alpha subunit